MALYSDETFDVTGLFAPWRFILMKPSMQQGCLLHGAGCLGFRV